VSIDSVPIYDHAIDYLTDIADAAIQGTIITISDIAKSTIITITEAFWSDLKNRVIERVDSGLSVT